MSISVHLQLQDFFDLLRIEQFGDWPLQIISAEDARRQAPVVLAIAEAELHQRIFDAGGNWRLVPAYCERIGESRLAEPEPVRGGSA